MTASLSLTTYAAQPLMGGRPTSLVVLLHGLGANGEDLLGLSELWEAMMPNTEFAAPDAPEPCDMAPMGFQWFSLAERTEAAMLAGARSAAPLLDAYLDELLNLHQLPDSKLALVGFSQGTMMALQVGLRRKYPPAAILGYSGVLLGGPGFDGDAFAGSITARPPVLLIHGTHDSVLPFAALAAAEATLKAAGVPVETSTRPGVGHSIDQQGAFDGGAFLARSLGHIVT